MTNHLYKIILFKEPTPGDKSRGAHTAYQYGLIEAEGHFKAEEAAKQIFREHWEPQGWKWHGCFFEDNRILAEGKVLWL